MNQFKITQKLITVLKELSEEINLKDYKWDIPKNCPIEIPKSNNSIFEKNIYLKENLRFILQEQQNLNHYYWIIQQWGGIASFKQNPTNDERIIKFIEELKNTKLTKNSFDRISSFSKVASFIDPDHFAIYDSRVIYALNWLIFNYAPEMHLFSQPLGRSTELAKYDMQTLFRLSRKKYTYRIYKSAYQDYCQLMKELSIEIYGAGSKPYLLEMLLFMIAPTKIVQDIERNVSIMINI